MKPKYYIYPGIENKNACEDDVLRNEGAPAKCGFFITFGESDVPGVFVFNSLSSSDDQIG